MFETSFEKIKTHFLLLIFSLFFLAQLFFHHYPHQGWTYLILLGFTLVLALFNRQSIRVPQKKWLLAFLFVFTVTALQSVLNGGHLVEERWINRYIILLLIFTQMQFFTEENSLLQIKWPFLIFLFIVSSYSLFQYLYIFDFNSKYGLSTFSSRFWNISYYSQAMVLSLPLVSFFKKQLNQNSKVHFFYNSLLVILLITVFAAQSRTSYIGLTLFLLLDFIKPQGFQKKKLLALSFISFFLYWGIHDFKKNHTDNPTRIQALKNESLNFRSNLYKKTLMMAQDFPIGIGTNKFPYYLFLYLDDDKISENKTNLYLTPHSEPLQVLIEDGLVIFVVYVFCLILIFLKTTQTIISINKAQVFSRFFICLLPEIFFHFPSDMYYSVFLFSLLIGSFLKNSIQVIQFKFFTKTIAVTLASLVLITYIVRENYIIPESESELYCQIFHDNFEVCKRYFANSYVKNNFEKANNINRSILKYQAFNFNALALDYSLASEPRSSIASCLYYNLFNGKEKIRDSNTENCFLEKDRNKKIELFEEYSSRR